MRSHLIVWILFVATFSGCADLFLDEDPANTPLNNFESLWNGFDDYYAGFATRSIDWDSMYASCRPKINSRMTDAELHAVFIEMLKPLKDPHIVLYADGFKPFSYQKPAGNFLDFSANAKKYLSNWNSSGPITYGYLDNKLGYVYIDNFRNPSNVYNRIEQIVEEFQSLEGVVIDIRNNGGGEAKEAYKIASHFADQERLFAYSRSKSGPDRSALSDFFALHISPSGKKQFTRPMAVLTNRMTGSAAEFMTLMIRSFPYAIHVGDTTGGGISGQITRELPNGWTYTLSPGVIYPPDKIPIEGKGITPHVTVTISSSDSIAGNDTILEEAMRLLK